MSKAATGTRLMRNGRRRSLLPASLLAVGAASYPGPAGAVPNIAITRATAAQAFTTATTTASLNHVVPSTGANRALVVPVGVSSSTASISSVVWIPNTATSGVSEPLTCTSQVVIGTNRRLAICRLQNPTPDASATGRVTITRSSASTLAASATTFTGVIGLGPIARSFDGLVFSSAAGCTAQGTKGYNCSLTVPGVTSSYAIFDLVGQGQPGPGTRTVTAGPGQTKRDDPETDVTSAHLRMATSTKIVPNAATSTTLSWFHGGATASNGVGYLALPLQGNAVTAATLGAASATAYAGAGTRVSWTTEEGVSHRRG